MSECPNVGRRSDNHDTFDTGRYQFFDSVIDDGFIVDGQKMLVSDMCEGVHSSTCASC